MENQEGKEVPNAGNATLAKRTVTAGMGSALCRWYLTSRWKLTFNYVSHLCVKPLQGEYVRAEFKDWQTNQEYNKCTIWRWHTGHNVHVHDVFLAEYVTGNFFSMNYVFLLPFYESYQTTHFKSTSWPQRKNLGQNWSAGTNNIEATIFGLRTAVFYLNYFSITRITNYRTKSYWENFTTTIDCNQSFGTWFLW